MLRWLIRCLVRTVVIIAVLIVIAGVIDYFSHRVQPGSVLVVRLQGPAVERGSGGLRGLINPDQTPLDLIREAIDRGASDPRIVGLAISVIDPSMELAQAQELSDLIHSFASAGKWTVAYMETAGEGEPGNLPYLVASSAQEVSMMPQGEINLVGVGIRELFARDMLDWIGVKPDFAAAGKYKDAGNIFTEKDITPAQREEDQALLDSMFNQIVALAASNRRLTPDAVRALVNQAPLNASAGLKAHLLDRIEYEDEFKDRVKNHGGQSHALVDYAAYVRPSILPHLGHHADRLAVVYGVGAIARGESGFDPVLSPSGTSMGSDDMASAFEQARDDDSVRAVVFRINSPGGSVIASELIRREVELTAIKKPVVVSMSSYGASGGYWVAMPAAMIFAEPGTVTGSIGVLDGKFNLAQAAHKLGVNSVGMTLGDNVGMFDSFTDFSPSQQAIRDHMLVQTYQHFVELVAKSRHLTLEQVDKIAQGRVWTGEQGVQNKLTDSLGGLDAALKQAKVLAKLPPNATAEYIELPAQPGLLPRVFAGKMSAEANSAYGGGRLLEPLLRTMRAILARHGAFGAAYCPLVPVM